MVPDTQYARSGDAYLAYKTLGSGQLDLMLTFAGPSHLDYLWELPESAAFFERLAGLGRLVMYDKRGTGMSEATFEPTSLDQRAHDCVAVMDAAGSRMAVQLGWLDGGAVALATAALHPDRVSRVVAGEVTLPGRPDGTSVPGTDQDVLTPLIAAIEAGGWGQGVGLRPLGPVAAENVRLATYWRRFESMTGTPRAAARMFRDIRDLDLRPLLPRINAPVLLIHDEQHPTVAVEDVRRLAEHLPDARLRPVRGGEVAGFILGDEAFAEIEEFLTGVRSSSQAQQRVRTLLVTDLVGSTEQLSSVGDSGWHALLATHRSAVRRAIARHDGQEVDTAGDGFLIAFALPSAALRCAAEVVRESTQSGVRVRAGVHAGEVLVRDTGIVGVAVHVAARIAAQASAGEVLVSDTVRVLVAGAGIGFESAGSHVLRGVPDTWPLHRLLTDPARG